MVDGREARTLIVISGYYGFGNLGDEAILEQLVCELKRLVPPESIVILSNDPVSTERVFGVRSLGRSRFASLARVLTKAKLLVSGGGGLFQDTRSPGSVLFYGAHIMLARLAGAQALVYAQGVGPLRSAIATMITRAAFRLTSAISVRDERSLDLVKSWHLPVELTADPVWCLAPTDLPAQISSTLPGGPETSRQPLIGLSLRPSSGFTDVHMDELLHSLLEALPAEADLLLLPLQKEQDEPVLHRFATAWRQAGRRAFTFNPDELTLPSQWLTLLSRLDLLVSMRLHALIMALRSGVATVGIAYDPKVVRLLTNFEQPILNLTKESAGESWKETLKDAYRRRNELSTTAVGKTEAAKNLACQNFNFISRILNMQSDPNRLI
jgi:polysaccharide pyruvyl transferase CsaB